MKRGLLLGIIGCMLFLSMPVAAQQTLPGYFTNLEEAKKNALAVKQLDLNNFSGTLPTDWDVLFPNLESLSLQNDNLLEVPASITRLKKLRVLNLSGNPIRTVPESMAQLTTLEELYLNNDAALDLPQTLKILAKLPKLKSLHLDNDGLVQLPQELYALKQLESLYLNNNKLPEIPRQLEGLPHLQYLEMRNNKLQPDVIDTRNLNFGFKIQL